MGLWDSPAGVAALQKFDLSPGFPGSPSQGNTYGKLSDFLDPYGAKLKEGLVCSPQNVPVQQKGNTYGKLSDFLDPSGAKLKEGLVCSPQKVPVQQKYGLLSDFVDVSAGKLKSGIVCSPSNDTACKHFSPGNIPNYNVEAQVNFARTRSGYQPAAEQTDRTRSGYQLAAEQTDKPTNVTLTDRQKYSMEQNEDPTNFISAEDVFDSSGVVKPGCEHIVKSAVFMLPDGTSCSMEDIIRDNKLNIGKFFSEELHTTSPYPQSEVTVQIRSPSLEQIASGSGVGVPNVSFIFQGVEISPEKFYYGPIAGIPGVVRLSGSQLFRLQDDPHQILAVYNNAYHHLGSLMTEDTKIEHDQELERQRAALEQRQFESDQRRRPLRHIPNTTTVLTSTTEISNPKVFERHSVPCDKATSPGIGQPIPAAPSPPKKTGVNHKTPLVFQIAFNTILEGQLKGVPLGQKGYPLRVGPYGHFLYPLSEIGEALGPDGKPLPIADDGRVKWPTDLEGFPICPKKYRVPLGLDGYPIAPDQQPYEPCGRLAIKSSQGPRLAIGPNGIVLFPINGEGKSCDLNGEPFPALSDGRPCWPCNAEGQPIAADGGVVNVGTDGYPVDLRGRFLSPGGTIVVKTKMPYPNLSEVLAPEYLQTLNFTDKMVHFPFSYIFGQDFQINEIYKSVFTVPGATVLLPEQFMEHAPNHVYKSLNPSPPFKAYNSPGQTDPQTPYKPYNSPGQTDPQTPYKAYNSPGQTDTQTPYKAYNSPGQTDTQTVKQADKQRSPQQFYDAPALYHNSPRCSHPYHSSPQQQPSPYKHQSSHSQHKSSPCKHSSPHHHPTAPHQHVTSPHQHVTSPHQHVTSSQYHTTSPPQYHTTSPPQYHTTSSHTTPRRHNHLYKNYEVPGLGTPHFNTPGSPSGKQTNKQTPGSPSGKQTNRQNEDSTKQKRKVTPFYAVYLNNQWVQIAKKHARLSKSKPAHLVVKYNNSTYLVPQGQVRPLQVSGAGPRELVTLTVPSHLARGEALSRTFSVERISQPTSTDNMFVLQLAEDNMPSHQQITDVKKEILGIHPTASILTEAQFRTLGVMTLDDSDSKPIMVRLEGNRAPHYFRYVEELITEPAEEVKKQTTEGVVKQGGSDVSAGPGGSKPLANVHDISIPC